MDWSRPILNLVTIKTCCYIYLELEDNIIKSPVAKTAVKKDLKLNPIMSTWLQVRRKVNNLSITKIGVLFLHTLLTAFLFF